MTRNESYEQDEQAIHALFEAGDRALMSADAEALDRVFADDYVQYDAAGRAWTKAEILDNFRTGAIRYPSIVSTGRTIRLFCDWAIVHGSESDEVETGGEREAVKYLYMDVVCKRDGQWRILASQLAKPAE
jgi:uncharacterized protein (TIGR02246 family)